MRLAATLLVLAAGHIIDASAPAVAERRTVACTSPSLPGPRVNGRGGSTDWEPFRLGSRALTRYTVAGDSHQVLLADAERSASLLFARVDADVRTHPVLRWRWRVDRIPAGGDLRLVERDDAAARVFVGFRYDPGSMPWRQNLVYRAFRLRHGAYPPFAALAYVWATAPPEGAELRHPGYQRLHQVVLHAGLERCGSWLEERRNVLSDYRAAFGAEPPPVAYVAVMTDADDTSGSAAAAYADIRLEAAEFPVRPAPASAAAKPR